MFLHQISAFNIHLINLKYQVRHRMKSLSYLMGHMLYLWVKFDQDYFECNMKKHETFTYNPPVRTNVNKIENTINFKIKTGYSLEL